MALTIALTLIAVGVLVFQFLLLVGVFDRTPDIAVPSWLDAATSRRLVVHTIEGQTVEGSLATADDDGLVLIAARLVDHDVPLAGDVWIPRAKVLLVQAPPAARTP